MPARDADVAVIGAGVVGLSLTDALVRRGVSVLCFERGVSGASQSGGVTRIFRHAHSEARLVELAVKARGVWRELEERFGETLVGDEGVMILGAAHDEAARLADLGVSVDELSAPELRRKLPIASEPTDDALRAVFERDGGAIRASRVVAHLRDAVSDRLVAAEVYGVATRDTDVEIYASDGARCVGEAFVTAGAETSALARVDGVEIAEDRACHLRVTFANQSGDVVPCLLDRSGQFGETVYGSPTPDGKGYAIGISGSDGAVAADCLVARDPAALAAIQERTQVYARRAFADVLGGVIATRLCLATPLVGGDDLFHTWREGRATYFAGHNLFKFAPILGELLAATRDNAAIPEILLSW
jgi:sarcosine oxidase